MQTVNRSWVARCTTGQCGTADQTLLWVREYRVPGWNFKNVGEFKSCVLKFINSLFYPRVLNFSPSLPSLPHAHRKDIYAIWIAFSHDMFSLSCN